MTPEASDFFLKAMGGYRVAKILLVANRLGLFKHTDGAGCSADALAERLGLPGEALVVLLRALVSMGLVAARGALYHNTALASAHLVAGKPDYVGNTLRMHDMLWENWSNLEAVLRTDQPWKTLPELLGAQDQEFTREYIRGMQPLAAAPSREIAQLLSDRPLKSVLDVGGGPGTYTLALLARNPHATGTVLDLATTLAVTRELLAGHAAAQRVLLREGNYLKDEYGADFDLVFMSHVTHDESPSNVALMARKAYAALSTGGRLAIHDWVVVPGTSPAALASALFAVNLTTYTFGRLYSREEYAEILRGAGFADVSAREILSGKAANPTWLIVAQKM